MRSVLMRLSLSVWLIGLLLPTGSFAVNVSIDLGTEYQTMVGFGAYGAISPWKIKQGPFYVDVDLEAEGTYDMLATDLSVFRTEINPEFQTSAGGDYNYPNLTHFLKLKERGVRHFISSVWSPPAYMKDNNMVKMGGHLKANMRDDFGEYCVEWLKNFKQQMGFDLYALSLQNEPLFTEPYKSCVYDNNTYRDLVKVAGPIIDNACPNVKLFGPEDMTKFPDRQLGWVKAIVNDPAAKPHLDIVASHGYGAKGVLPGNAGDDSWQQIYNYAKQHGMETAMTETSGYPDTWDGGLSIAVSIHGSLKHGKICMWVHWTLMGEGSSVYHLINDGQPTKRYYAHVQWGRFVRPGAKMVESSSDDGNVLVTAFSDEAAGRVSIVLINRASSSKSVTLGGSGLPGTFNVCRTSATEDCKSMGTTGKSATLPAKSITTLYSGDVVSAIQPKFDRLRNKVRQAAAKHVVQVYSIDGRLVRVISGTELLDKGPAVWDRRDSFGKAVAPGTYFAVSRHEDTGRALKVWRTHVR